MFFKILEPFEFYLLWVANNYSWEKHTYSSVFSLHNNHFSIEPFTVDTSGEVVGAGLVEKKEVNATLCPENISKLTCNISFYSLTAPGGSGPPHYRGFTITPRHTELSRTPLDEWSARHRELYLTIHNTHERRTFMPPVGFEPTIPANDRPQPHATDRKATAIVHAI